MNGLHEGDLRAVTDPGPEESGARPSAVRVPYLAHAGQGAVGPVAALLVGEPPAAEAVHGVRGDGVAELLEGVIPVPAHFDLLEELGELAGHGVVWRREDRGNSFSVV